MKRYVAILTTVFLLALAAAAQSQSAGGVAVPPHGCGPGQPPAVVEVVHGAVPARRVPVARAAEDADVILLGRAGGFTTAAGERGSVRTRAYFPSPLVLKAPAALAHRRTRRVAVSFPGGSALIGGLCTWQEGGPAMHSGQVYLVFGNYDAGTGRVVGRQAFPVDAKSGRVGSGVSRGDLLLGAGTPPTLGTAIAGIRAELAREAARRNEGDQP